MSSQDLLKPRPATRLGIPALAAGQGLSEAGFILAAKQGLTGGGPAALAAMAACVLLRYVFQDRGAALEARALREASAALRGRLIGALRARAVPLYRPEARHALDRALDETVPRAAEGLLARRGLEGAALQCAVLVPMLFVLSWRTAAFGLGAAALAWPVLRWRNRRLKALENAQLAAREAARREREEFSAALEGSFGGGFEARLEALDEGLDRTAVSEWRWRLAKARYPAVLETALFFVLAGVLLAGAFTLEGWDAWLLFTALLVLAYRPVREAARHYPVALQGARAVEDARAILSTWESHAPRAVPGESPAGKLALEDVRFAYVRKDARGASEGNGGHRVFDALSLELEPGLVTAITGPNGAGKTTLLRLLAGAETPEAGRVLWTREARARGVAYLPQRAHPGADWARWARALEAERPGPWRELDELLRLRALAERAAHPEALSGGERQRMALARALASDAAYLLLDEPATALPGDARERIVAGALALWKRSGRGAAVVSHEPFIERLCDAHVRLRPREAARAARGEERPEARHE